MITSRINYLIQVWGGTENKYIQKIQTILNETARFVMGKPRRTSTYKLMTSCNWMYVCELVNYHSMIMMWNVVNRNTPLHLRMNIDIDENCRLSTGPARLQTTLTSYRWRSIPMWNELDDDLKFNRSLPAFKRNLKRWIILQRTTPG